MIRNGIWGSRGTQVGRGIEIGLGTQVRIAIGIIGIDIGTGRTTEVGRVHIPIRGIIPIAIAIGINYWGIPIAIAVSWQVNPIRGAPIGKIIDRRRR
jgi:hypothetical protein